MYDESSGAHIHTESVGKWLIYVDLISMRACMTAKRDGEVMNVFALAFYLNKFGYLTRYLLVLVNNLNTFTFWYNLDQFDFTFDRFFYISTKYFEFRPNFFNFAQIFSI